MKIFLFDMDGVLLEPHGYHMALQKSLSMIGEALGYRAVSLTLENIVDFEAAGLASEWDSSAICTTLLLVNLWAEYPLRTLPFTLPLPTHPQHNIASPDFPSFISALFRAQTQEIPPLELAERQLLLSAGSRTDEQNQTIQHILRTARQIKNSLTHRVFQELVLGSKLFGETYGLQPSLAAESTLTEYDRPMLSIHQTQRLVQWLQDTGSRAVIFTSRPSRPPAGHLCVPEAEIGAQGVELEMLPVLGQGGLSWLSAQRRRKPQAFLKPSPVHALAALRVALGEPLEDALEAAAALALDDQADHLWGALRGARVYVFEDTVPGLESVRAAQDILNQFDVPLNISLFGVTDNETKRKDLEAAGARLTPLLSSALEDCGLVWD